MCAPASASVSRKAEAPRPLSRTIVTPVVRGRRSLRLMITSRDQTPSQGDLKAGNVMRQLPQRPFDHRQIRAPRDDHDIALSFDVKFPETALQNRRLVSRTSDEARTDFHSWRLIAIVVTVELQAALAADQCPVVALGRSLIEVIDRSAEIVEPSRPARDEEGWRHYASHQLFQFDTLKHRDNRRQISVT